MVNVVVILKRDKIIFFVSFMVIKLGQVTHEQCDHKNVSGSLF